jgi:hypothetical protein
LPQSELVTIGVEEGLDDLDQDRMRDRHAKVFFDALRRAYRRHYGVPTFHLDELMELASGRGVVSYALMPAVVGGYAYYHGIERSFRVGGFKVSARVKKLRRVFEFDDGDEAYTVGAIHVRPDGLFFGVVASVEEDDDGFGPGFIGLATDTAAVLEAVEGRRGPERD